MCTNALITRDETLVAETQPRAQIKSAARGEVEAVLSTFRVVDLDGDYTEHGAFTDGATVPIGVWAHDSVIHGLPHPGVGRITTATDARVVGRYLLDSEPRAQRV